MEHHMHHNNPPLHWGYTSTPPSHNIHNTWVPPSGRGLKRSISESDCEDNYSETSSKDTSPKDTDADSCQHMSRKKRRGVIEKKRRDRINSSLSELKRLVPSAYEKQGSSKLEKAEILQLTVDHLKSLHSKGADALAYDPQRFAIDYHIIGFRECAGEVARYLLNHEGMDIQDPLRMRLLSHLQCFVAQREISAKSQNTAVTSGWPPVASTSHHTPYPIPQSAYGAVPSSSTATHAPVALPSTSSASPMYHQSGYTSSTQLNQSNSYAYIPNLPPSVIPSTSHLAETIPSSTASTSIQGDVSILSNHPHQVQQHYAQHEDQNGSTYTDLSSSVHRNTSVSIGYGNPQYPPSGAQGYNATNAVDGSTSPGTYNNNNKPYRPWGTGTEIAY